MKAEHEIIRDFLSLAENEVLRVKTGKAPGPAMRDIIGQWEATIRDARQCLTEVEIEIAEQNLAAKLLPEQFDIEDAGC